MLSSTLMTCLVLPAVGALVVTCSRSGSTLLRTCWTRVCGRGMPRGSWRSGSVVRRGRRTATCSARVGPDMSRYRHRRRCSPSSCRCRSSRGSARMPPRRGARCGRGRAGVGGVLGAGASRASAPVSERVVETEFVFDRLQAAELSAAYRILVPERPSRSVRAGQEASRADEQRSNLCPGLLGPAQGAGHDRIPDRSVACARRTAGLGRA